MDSGSTGGGTRAWTQGRGGAGHGLREHRRRDQGRAWTPGTQGGGTRVWTPGAQGQVENRGHCSVGQDYDLDLGLSAM